MLFRSITHPNSTHQCKLHTRGQRVNTTWRPEWHFWQHSTIIIEQTLSFLLLVSLKMSVSHLWDQSWDTQTKEHTDTDTHKWYSMCIIEWTVNTWMNEGTVYLLLAGRHKARNTPPHTHTHKQHTSMLQNTRTRLNTSMHTHLEMRRHE